MYASINQFPIWHQSLATAPLSTRRPYPSPKDCQRIRQRRVLDKVCDQFLYTPTSTASNLIHRYNNFLNSKTLPNFRWCSNPNCTSGQVHSNGDSSPKMICTECSFVTCFTHQRPWHEGRTCEEFDEQGDPTQKKQEAASEKTVEQSSAPCPSCSAPVTKISGCPNVRCECCLFGGRNFYSCYS